MQEKRAGDLQLDDVAENAAAADDDDDGDDGGGVDDHGIPKLTFCLI